MREIKFRAWNTVTKQMAYFEPFKHVYSCEGNTVIESQKISSKPYKEGAGHVEEILMQYTEMKDAHGKEIFEGDVVELTLDVDRGGDPNERYYSLDVVPVTWGEKEGCWMAGDVQLATYVDDPDWERRCEVLGNIYENPKLLEASK